MDVWPPEEILTLHFQPILGEGDVKLMLSFTSLDSLHLFVIWNLLNFCSGSSLLSAPWAGAVSGVRGGHGIWVEVRTVCWGWDLALPILPQVSDATGQMNLTKVADSSPFALELLLSDDCFVLDNGLCGKIYVWKGTWGFLHSSLRPLQLL